MNRWGPWRTVPLPSDPSLCPVKCLKDYLAATPQICVGQLFRAPSSGSTLTTNQVRAKLLYFIKRGDPGSVPRGHDPRKIASSLAFFSSMSFADLQAYTGWSRPHVFYKHYLSQIEEVSRSVVSAGQIILPNAEEENVDNTAL